MKSEISKVLIALTLAGLQPSCAEVKQPWAGRMPGKREISSRKQPTPQEKPEKTLKVLVTGFQPFEDPINVSELALQHIDTASLRAKGVEVVTEMLYVNKGLIKEDLEKYVAQYQPDYVICLGEMNQADASSAAVRAERYALNERGERVYADTAFIDRAGRQMRHTHFQTDEREQEDFRESSCNAAFAEALRLKPEQAFFLHFSDYLYQHETSREPMFRTSLTSSEPHNELAERYGKQVTEFIAELAVREQSHSR